MPSFGTSSQNRLDQCAIPLQTLMEAVVLRRDCSIVCGHRDEQQQTLAFSNGASKAKWGQSPHNSFPSMAVDVIPWPEQYTSQDAFKELAEVIFEEAIKLQINVKWGGFFRSFSNELVEKDGDKPHWELK